MFKRNLKAVVAFVGTLSGALAMVIVGDETLLDVSQAEWIVIVGTLTGVPLGVYAAGNSN